MYVEIEKTLKHKIVMANINLIKFNTYIVVIRAKVCEKLNNE